MRAAVHCGEIDQGDMREETGGKCLWRKARQSWKQGDAAESCVGGGLSPYSLSLPTGKHWQLNIREAVLLNA